MKTILKTLVGSKAHGLARPGSDSDFRGVFVEPTSKILALGSKPRSTSWIEGNEDDTQWEIGHFLNLAVHCEPNALEVFGAPVIEADEQGDELRSLLPFVWSPKSVWNAYTGYSDNQWKKYFADKYRNDRNRATKFAMASARSLIQGRVLVETGEMEVKLEASTVESLVNFRDKLESGSITRGQVLDYIDRLKTGLWDAYQRNEDKEPDLDRVNEFLLRVRKANW